MGAKRDDAVITLGEADLLRVRMQALGLNGADPSGHSQSDTKGGVEGVAAVVDRLFALQGQDWRASKWAIGVRAPDVTSEDVNAALSAGRIVRSWPMRGTVHLIDAQDIGWVQRLTNPRVIAGAAKRREFLGMSDAVLGRVTDVTISALTGGTSLARDELGTIWSEAGIDWQPNWRYHLIWWLCQTGVTTFGPVPAVANRAGGTTADPEPRLVLASEWIREARTLTGDDALVEFAGRYVRGRGAVSQKDLAAWSMLPAADVKRALSLAIDAGRIVPARRADVTGTAGALWVDPHHLDPHNLDPHHLDTSAHGPAWHLMPAFDEHLLGYNMREPQLAPGQLEHIVPGRNGVFRATVVRGGKVTGTWRRNPKTKAVEVTALGTGAIDLDALRPEVERWAQFTGTIVSEVITV